MLCLQHTYIDMNNSRRLFTLILTTICLLNIYSLSNAQVDHRLGNWNTFIFKAKISPKVSLISENQFRSNNYDLKYDYFEVKAGISYNITRNLTALIGTGIYNTYLVGELFQTPARQKEFRTWLELNYKHAFSRFNFDHRVRIEQRFIPGNYKNRLKYRLGLILPVNRSELIQGCIYLSVNNEVWLPQHGVLIEKNRLYTGIGYKINGNAAFQIGCINDNDYKSDGHSVKNYLQLMLIYDFTKLFKKLV